jgi:hypothetical protein
VGIFRGSEGALRSGGGAVARRADVGGRCLLDLEWRFLWTSGLPGDVAEWERETK